MAIDPEFRQFREDEAQGILLTRFGDRVYLPLDVMAKVMAVVDPEGVLAGPPL